MNISLTPELEKLIHSKVKTGAYLSASEVVREALRLLQDRDQLRELRTAELRKEIQKGIDEYERGEFVTVDVKDLPKYMAELREKAMRQLKARSNGKRK